MQRIERYDPKIDALRGVSFAIVFIGHFAYGNHFFIALYKFAPFGVVLFFCLSGFLLGRVVLAEFEKTQRINISRFFIRRAFRILPLYIVFLGVIFLLSEFSKLGNGSLQISGREWLGLLTFSYNLMSVGDSSSSPLPSVTWSLSIEEQIYLFFPFISLLLAKKKFLLMSIMLPTLISILWLAQINLFESASVDRLTGLYLIPVLSGLLCAKFEKRIRLHIGSRLNLFFRVSIVTATIFILLMTRTSSDLNFVLAVLAISTIFPFVLNLFSRIKEGVSLNILSRIGRISFGCYLYHWIFWNVLQKFTFAFSDTSGFTIFGWMIGIISTLILALASYRFIELPFLNLRRRFQVVQTS